MNNNDICLTDKFLTQQEASEFQTLVTEIMGIKLNLNEAEDQGSRLIMIFEALQRFEPIPLSGKDAVEMDKKEVKNGIN